MTEQELQFLETKRKRYLDLGKTTATHEVAYLYLKKSEEFEKMIWKEKRKNVQN